MESRWIGNENGGGPSGERAKNSLIIPARAQPLTRSVSAVNRHAMKILLE